MYIIFLKRTESPLNIYTNNYAHQLIISTRHLHMHAHRQAVKSAYINSQSIILSHQHQTFLLFPELLVSIGNCYPGNTTEREKVSEWVEERGKKTKMGRCRLSYLSFVSPKVNYK